MINTIDMAWLGGLLEGEAYFGLNYGKHPIISVGMTAEDTITKIAAMWDTRVTRHRNLYVTRVNGFKAVKWMMLLLPFLGKCRKENIASIIKVWKENTYVNVDGTRHMAKCHPDRAVMAFDMCSVCYMRERRKKDKKLLRKVG